MTGHEAFRLLRDFLEPLCTVLGTFELFELAIAVRDEAGFSFYDSLNCAGAIIGGAKVFYSEDMQDGHSVRGVVIKKAFSLIGSIFNPVGGQSGQSNRISA